MPGDRRRKWLTVAAVAGLSILFLDRAVVIPLANTWQTRAEQMAFLRGEVDEAHDLIARKEAIETRWAEMLAGGLPRDEAAAESHVLKSVDGWAVGTGLSVIALTPNWAREAGGAAYLDCRASASGTMRQVVRFLYELETAPLALSAEELTLTATDGRGAQLGVSLRFSGVVMEEADE